MERWEPIPGMEGIAEASTDGKIRSVSRTTIRMDGRTRTVNGKVLKTTMLHGHKTVCLSVGNGKKTNFTVARLILSTFCNVDHGQLLVGYTDGDRRNTRLDNLFWQTKEEASTTTIIPPTLAEIEEETAKIRSGWTEREFKNRWVHKPARVVAPMLTVHDLPVQLEEMIMSINKDYGQ